MAEVLKHGVALVRGFWVLGLILIGSPLLFSPNDVGDDASRLAAQAADLLAAAFGHLLMAGVTLYFMVRQAGMWQGAAPDRKGRPLVFAGLFATLVALSLVGAVMLAATRPAALGGSLPHGSPGAIALITGFRLAAMGLAMGVVAIFALPLVAAATGEPRRGWAPWPDTLRLAGVLTLGPGLMMVALPLVLSAAVKAAGHPVGPLTEAKMTAVLFRLTLYLAAALTAVLLARAAARHRPDRAAAFA